MNKEVINLLGEAQKKMSAYTAWMNFRFVNLSIKADAAALLSVTVNIDDEEYDIENVAEVAVLEEENQLAILPKDPSFIFAICKGIKLTHPEYEIEEKEEREEGVEAGSGEGMIVLYCSMPAMNEDRYEACNDYIATVSDETKTKLDLTRTTYSAKIARKLSGESVDFINQMNDEMDKIYKQHTDLCQQYEEQKRQEVEKSYQDYLAEKTKEEVAANEAAAARGENMITRMKMGEDE